MFLPRPSYMFEGNIPLSIAAHSWKTSLVPSPNLHVQTKSHFDDGCMAHANETKNASLGERPNAQSCTKQLGQAGYKE
jgi:hypothetical protein